MRHVLLGLLLVACTPRPTHLTWADDAGVGDVVTVVQAAAAQARREGQKLVVYVGATWCEPCERFHRAATAGELDADFAQVRILAFDADRDRERLAAAGYSSDLIPLLVVPAADGRASARRMQGSVKGARAVAEMTPRLRALLEQR